MASGTSHSLPRKRSHSGSTLWSPANGGAMNRSNHWLFKIDQRADQLGLWTLAWSWGVPHEVLHIIPRTERIAGTMPEHDTYVVVLRGGVERVRDGDVHR